MSKRKSKKGLKRDGVPLWLSVVIDGFIVSIPFIIRKVVKIIIHLGGHYHE